MSKTFYDSLEEAGDLLIRIRKHLKALSDDIEGIESSSHIEDPRFESSLDHVKMAEKLVNSSHSRIQSALDYTPVTVKADIAEKNTKDTKVTNSDKVIVEKVPGKKSVRGYVMTIAFFVLTTIASVALASYFHDESERYQRRYASAHQEAEKGLSELERINNERQSISAELTELKSFKQNYDSRFPFVITSFEFGNGRSDANPSIYGERLYGSDLYYVYTKISYVGNVNGNKTVKVKWYRNDSLWRGTSSPSGCTYTTNVDVSEGDNTATISGWGSNTAGNSWSAGNYRIEVWYGDNLLGSSNMSVY